MRTLLRAIPGAWLALGLAAWPGLAVDLGDGLVRLRHETYSAASGPAAAAGRMQATAPDETATWVAVVAGPVDESAHAAVRAGGARVIGYVPSRAYLLRGTLRQMDALRAAGWITRADRYRDEWKLSPDIGRREFRDPARLALAPALLLDVFVFEGEDPASVAAAAGATGASILAVHGAGQGNRIVVVADPSALPALARISEVEWIEEQAEPELRNDNVRWVIQSNVSGQTPLYARGLLGEGEIIGHIDGEIVQTSCFFVDPVNNTPGPGHRKIVGYRSSGNTFGAGHGTHTAGTAAGERDDGNTASRGMAPKARLSFANVNDITGIGNTTSNLLAAFETAHAEGARVHSNSWGEISVGSYTTWSVDVDTFTRNREDALVVFAVINSGTVISPENAKNCLAVAATQAAPNQNLHGSGATGPTYDGRRKPEVMAPGRNTVSAGTGPGTCATLSMSGTSMAAPAVAGGAALVRQYFRQGFYPTGARRAAHGFVPTGALLKAVVVNSVVDVTGIANNPSNLEGWGRILLDDALYFAGDSRRLIVQDVRHAQGLGTGGVDEFAVTVLGSGQPLAVTMAFTDRPAVHGAAMAPVNDLDLEVQGPGGLFRGNVFNVATGVSVTGGAADALNNLERVRLAAPAPGVWTVRVRGASVPFGPQGYAVAVNGKLLVGHENAPAPEGHAVPEPEARPEVRVTPDDFRLGSPSPSPFRDHTAVSLAVPVETRVQVTVHDVRGRLVRSLLERPMAAGEHTVSWDGRDDAGRPVPGGVYLVRLIAPGASHTVKAVRLR